MSDFTVDQAIVAPPLGVEDRAPPRSASRPGRTIVPRLSGWEKLGWLLMAALFVVGLPMAYQRAADDGPDLAGFCDAGRYILQHGTRDPDSTLARYWPSADVPWIPVSLLPISVVAVLWYGLNCAAWFGLLRTICDRLLVGCDSESVQDIPIRSASEGGKPLSRWRSVLVFVSRTYCIEGPSCLARRHATLAAGLLAMPLVIDGMALGSFHVLMIWLMLLGLDRAFRGRSISGGILLGTAAWLKLLPLLGIAFLLFHRKWKAAATGLATVVVLDVALSLAAFGPAGAWREHVLWWQKGAQGTTDRQLTADKPVDEDRVTNESVAITLRRLLTSLGTTALPAKNNVGVTSVAPNREAADEVTPTATTVRQLTPNGRLRQYVRIAELSAGQLYAAYLFVSGLLFLAVAVYCRPVRPAEWAEKGPSKLVMLSLATLWFSPVTWSYHFVAATPALAALLLRARYRWAWILPVFLLWGGALCLLKFETMRVAGVLLWMSLLLGAGLLVYPRYVSRTER
jgi:hypothetical protein